jgi:hypothetical protein
MQLFVNISTWCYIDDRDNPAFFDNFKDDAISADAEPVEASQRTEQRFHIGMLPRIFVHA